MIDLNKEQVISLAQAARRVPSSRLETINGGKVIPSTIWRWATKGLRRRADGANVRLEAVRLGNSWVTTVEAIQRFSEALTGEQAATPEPISVRTPTKRQAASDRASEKLRLVGI